MHNLSLSAQLEAVLFVANEPLAADQLAKHTNATAAEVTTALTQLSLNLSNRGLQLNLLEGEYRLVTAAAADEIVRTYLRSESRSELSRAALETLAIIAYQGPLTRARIDETRGVASEIMLRNLQQRDLITEAGRADEPGRPLLYQVSHAFLQHFGLESLAQLPHLPKASSDEN